MKAVVLGAGPSGMSLAWFLSRNRWKVELFEKQNYVGGLGSSKEINIKERKIFLDSGPHIFHTNDQEMISIWKKNFSSILNEQILYSANCKGNDFNEFHDYPISKEGLKKNNIQFSKIDNFIDDPFMYSNYRDYMKARVGSEIEKKYFRKYPEKIWGMKTSQMRADWAPKRIEIREKINPFFINQWVATSKYGSGYVYESMKKNILENNGNIHLNTKVINLKIEDSEIKNIITSNNSFPVDNDVMVISCLPTVVMGKILNINYQCNYRGVAIVSAIHKTNKLPKDYAWIYFDDIEINFTRLTNYSKLSPQAANGLNIFMYEIPFDSNQNLKKENIINDFKKSIEKIPWLRNNIEKVLNVQIERYVYPIREMGYEKNISKIHSYADSLNNLIRSGTAAEFEYGDVQICFRKSLDLSNDLKKHPKVNKKSINKKRFEIKSKYLKNDYKIRNDLTFIAEIGLNHNGNVELAKKLIDISVKANCDYVKLQLYNSETRANQFTRDAFYKEDSDGEGENLFQIFKRCELDFEDMKSLYDYSQKAGIKLFFSAFDRESVRKAYQISPRLLKISSMDLTNFEVCDEARNLFKNIIMSTGMSTIEDIEKSSKFLKDKIGDNLTLLHCVSSYPMDINSSALGTIPFLKKYANKVGYSDHSLEIYPSLLAVLFGAQVIEKHITLDKKLSGPDHIHSLESSELIEMVSILNNFQNINKVRSGLIGVESKEFRRQKKGYYYKKDIKEGSKLSFDDLILMPPCIGDDTFQVSEIIGKRLLSSKRKLEPVYKTDCEL